MRWKWPEKKGTEKARQKNCREKRKTNKKIISPSSSLGASQSRANHSSTPISKARECTP